MNTNKLKSVIASVLAATAILGAAEASHAAGCRRTRSVPPPTEGATRTTTCTDASARASVQFISDLGSSKSYLLQATLLKAAALSTSTKLLNGSGFDIAGCFISDGSTADGTKTTTCIVPDTNPAVSYKLTAGNGPVE